MMTRTDRLTAKVRASAEAKRLRDRERVDAQMADVVMPTTRHEDGTLAEPPVQWRDPTAMQPRQATYLERLAEHGISVHDIAPSSGVALRNDGDDLGIVTRETLNPGEAVVRDLLGSRARARWDRDLRAAPAMDDDDLQRAARMLQACTVAVETHASMIGLAWIAADVHRRIARLWATMNDPHTGYRAERRPDGTRVARHDPRRSKEVRAELYLDAMREVQMIETLGRRIECQSRLHDNAARRARDARRRMTETATDAARRRSNALAAARNRRKRKRDRINANRERVARSVFAVVYDSRA